MTPFTNDEMMNNGWLLLRGGDDQCQCHVGQCTTLPAVRPLDLFLTSCHPISRSLLTQGRPGSSAHTCPCPRSRTLLASTLMRCMMIPGQAPCLLTQGRPGPCPCPRSRTLLASTLMRCMIIPGQAPCPLTQGRPGPCPCSRPGPLLASTLVRCVMTPGQAPGRTEAWLWN